MEASLRQRNIGLALGKACLEEASPLQMSLSPCPSMTAKLLIMSPPDQSTHLINHDDCYTIPNRTKVIHTTNISIYHHIIISYIRINKIIHI